MSRKKKVIDYSVEENSELPVEEVILEETVELPEEVILEEVAMPVVEEKIIEPVVEDKDAIVKRIKENAAQFGKEYFEKMKASGCDYESCGDWQKLYANLINAIYSVKGKAVLDIGGAFGSISKSLLDLGAQKATCADISKFVIESKKFKNVEYIHAPIQFMKGVVDGAYDLVHASHMLEYVHDADIERSIKEISRVMKSGGICIILGTLDTEAYRAHCEAHIGDVLKIDIKSCKEAENFRNYGWKYLIVRKK